MLIMILVVTKNLKELFRDLYYRKLSINETERKQDKFDAIIGALENYTSKSDKYIEAKNRLLNNVKNFLRGEIKNYWRVWK